MSAHRPFVRYKSVSAAQVKSVAHQKREYVRANSCRSLISVSISFHRMCVEWFKRLHEPWNSSAGRKAKAEQKQHLHRQNRHASRQELADWQPTTEAVFGSANPLPNDFNKQNWDEYRYKSMPCATFYESAAPLGPRGRPNLWSYPEADYWDETWSQ